jgi:hypothetical protein
MTAEDRTERALAALVAMCVGMEVALVAVLIHSLLIRALT